MNSKEIKTITFEEHFFLSHMANSPIRSKSHNITDSNEDLFQDYEKVIYIDILLEYKLLDGEYNYETKAFTHRYSTIYVTQAGYRMLDRCKLDAKYLS